MSSPRRTGPNLAQSYAWASRVSTVAGEGVLPPVLGYWADSRWGTTPWLTIVGGALGFALLMYEVMRLSAPKGGGKS
ncbi:MAG: AtpZ/AtpI family protein [Planctomycetaceae bacterium]|nr:AtpZ/AtpI family protein [Planctomycetaceae bacterium]